jgi:hypothetical protein
MAQARFLRDRTIGKHEAAWPFIDRRSTAKTKRQKDYQKPTKIYNRLF